jgi:hypothetical protein
MELQETYMQIDKILKQADKDIKRIMKRNNYCAGWEGFFNLQDTRVTKSNAFDKIHKLITQNNPEFKEEQKVDWDSPSFHKTSATQK